MSELFVVPDLEPSMIAEDSGDYLSSDIIFDMNGLGKRLFRVSNRAVLDFLRYFYHEVEGASEVLDIQGREMVDYTLKKATLDLLIHVLFPEASINYHIEMETEYTKIIDLRMFDYGYRVAKEHLSYDSTPTPLIFPRPLLIILEENRNAPSKLELLLHCSMDSPTLYEVPTLFLWTYSPEELLENNLYLLLPFKVFSYRKEMNSISKSQASSIVKRKRWVQCRESLLEEMEKISEILNRVFDEGRLTVEETGSMYAIMGDIVLRLTRKYPEIKDMKEEVELMRDTWYDPALVEKGKVEEIKESIGSLLSLKEDFKDYVYEVEERLSREDNLVILRDWHTKAALSPSVKSFLQKVSPSEAMEMRENWISPIEERAKAESRLEEAKRSITSLLSTKPDYANYSGMVQEILFQKEDITLLRDWLLTAANSESVRAFLKKIKVLN